MANHETQTTEGRGADFGRLWTLGGVLAVAGLALFGFLGYTLLNSKENWADLLLGSYMFGLMFWVSITIGCLGLTLLHHTVRGSWSVPLLRIWEAGGGVVTLVFMAILFIPIIVGMLTGWHHMYHWLHPEGDIILEHKSKYLNFPFWILRFVIIFAVWIFFSGFMRKSTLKQDESRNFRLEAGRSSWGAAGLVAFFMMSTFAAIDWLMSIDGHWYSTMYGVWIVVGSAYGALALAAFVITSNASKAPYRDVMHPNLTKDIGNMMFVLTMLWGYTTLSQYLIIWNGNIPETTQYFAMRTSSIAPPGMEGNNWGVFGFILMIGMFFIPFYSLLAPRTKRKPESLRKVAIWMFCMAVLNMYMIVIPSLPYRAHMGPLSLLTVTDILAWLGIGGVWLATFGALIKKAPLLPLYDSRLQEAKKHAH
jgi:hypothetical protein